MVIYKLVHYSSQYATIFTLVSAKVFTCKRQSNLLKSKLVEWKFHHILGGWGRPRSFVLFPSSFHFSKALPVGGQSA